MLRLLTAVELFLNPQYYANHLKLTESKRPQDSLTPLYFLCDSGQKEFEKKGSQSCLLRLAITRECFTILDDIS